MLTRQQIIDHILNLKVKDEDYARYALKEYNMLMPWLLLNQGVKDAINDRATPLA